MATAQAKICERNLVAAYVDGELDAGLTAAFEDHLESCSSCRIELRAHQMFVCELDAAFTQNIDLPVPDDFSRMVAVRAASDMRGVRTRSEHRKALTICLLLALAGFALAGATARDTIFFFAGKLVSKVFAVVGLLASTIYDAVAGLVVVVRVFGRRTIIETGSLWPMLVLLAFGVLILSRLISNYHRSGATE